MSSWVVAGGSFSHLLILSEECDGSSLAICVPHAVSIPHALIDRVLSLPSVPERSPKVEDGFFLGWRTGPSSLESAMCHHGYSNR